MAVGYAVENEDRSGVEEAWLGSRTSDAVERLPTGE
jgi:hypothetical protein